MLRRTPNRPQIVEEPSRIDPTTLDDPLLVLGVVNRDPAALEELYRRHAGFIHSMALRVLRRADLAADVVQDVMCSLWDRPERYDPERGPLRPWLLRVAHGRAVDLVRAEARREARHAAITGDADRAGVGLVDVEREALALLRAETVREAVAELRPAERECIELAYFGGYTFREVARMINVPEGTVKSRMRFALDHLARRLANAGLTTSGDR